MSPRAKVTKNVIFEKKGSVAKLILNRPDVHNAFNQDMIDYTGHQMAWLTIGIMAMISPLGMIVFRKTFNQSEKMGEEEVKNIEDEEEDLEEQA